MKIISGGQTGVDRAALDAALELGIPTGGWCPLGRKAEDGPIPIRYRLRETADESYAVRTRWNVRDTDGTLVFYTGTLKGGTKLTVETARELQKPVLLVYPQYDRHDEQVSAVLNWISGNRIETLNVAGPRQSEADLYAIVLSMMKKLIRIIRDQEDVPSDRN